MENKEKMRRIHKAKRQFMMGWILISFITLVFFATTKDVHEHQESYKEHMIRFHVLANSDSPEDQALKLKVRDRIIQEMNPKIEQSQSLDETREIIKENIKNIEAAAQDEIRRNGSSYGVKAILGQDRFPTKNYGSITLPAGTYEALRIIIGKGEGANWWCVMFPPLCFIDIQHGLTDERTKNELMQVLTEDEFKMISTADSGDQVPVKLKFKIVEIFESAKASFEKVVGWKE